MTTKSELLKVIRNKCVECMGFQEREIEKCTAPNCCHFPYRMGKDPEPNATRVQQAQISLLNTCCSGAKPEI
jgi:hypothetical protein